jgi:HAD superfamily hydrolase (TIGR01549 family)
MPDRQSPTRVRVLLFDLMGVLLFRRDDYAGDTLLDAIDEKIGGVTDDTRFKNDISNRYGLDDAQFNEVLRRGVEKYTAYPPLWELLPGLKHHYKLGIINNGTYLTYPLLNARYDLDGHFDIFFSSAREGICKPDSGIYLRACERLGLAPAECLFMDNEEQNVNGAGKAGMQTIHWPDRDSGFEAFRKWLERETG